MKTKNKNDLRYQKIEKKIKLAINKVLRQKDASLSVREICRIAKIRRSTFYRHYRNLRAMIDEIYQTIWNKWQAAFSKNDDEIFCVFYDLLWFVHDNCLSFEIAEEYDLLEHILNQLRPNITKRWSNYGVGLNDQMFVACRGALIEVIEYWFRDLNNDVDMIRKYATILKRLTDEFGRYGRIFAF